MRAQASDLELEGYPDTALAALAAGGDHRAVALITRRNNRRLFRVAWSILRSDVEAEDAVQSTYLRAFAALGSFQGRSSLSTWLTRIWVNEALQARRARETWWERLRNGSVAVLDQYRERLMRGSISLTAPDAKLARQQLRQLLEQALSNLPEKFRTVFVLREIEEMSVDDVAEVLSIPAATVKTRHLRARLRLQEELSPSVKEILAESLPFAGAKCASMSWRPNWMAAAALRTVRWSRSSQGGGSEWRQSCPILFKLNP